MTRFFKNLCLSAIWLCTSLAGNAQQNLVYNHYFINPHLYNPSYIATNGYSEVFLNYRKQWAQFNGSPTTATLNLQAPISYKMGVGLNFYNDQAGVLQTNSATVSFAYQIYLGKNTADLHRVSFGMSAGVVLNRIDLSQVDDPTDPSLTDSNSSGLDGRFGLNYQYNNLKIGFSLPRLFTPRLVSENRFNSPQFDQLNNTISTISYNFQITPRVAVEPFFMYRTIEGISDQFEVTGVLKIDNLIWGGGSYRQNFGPAAFLGFNLKDKLKVGYVYEFAPKQTSDLGNDSHEVQVILRIGKKKRERPAAAVPQEPEKELATQTTLQENKDEKPEPKQEEKTELKPVTPVVTEQKVEEKPEEKPVTPIFEQKVEEKVATETKVEEPKPQTEKEKITTLTGRGLKPGHYVVVGVFRSNQNALSHMNNLKKEGFANATVAYSATKQYYYVHMGNLATIEEAAQLRDQMRKETKANLRDSWVLSVE